MGGEAPVSEVCLVESAKRARSKVNPCVADEKDDGECVAQPDNTTIMLKSSEIIARKIRPGRSVL